MRTRLIAWLWLALLTSWAAWLLWDGSPAGVTALHGLATTFGATWLGLLLLAAVALAALGMTWGRGMPWEIWLKVPHLFVLLAIAAGPAQAVVTGHYADGVPRPRGFISSDQLPVLLLGALWLVTFWEQAGGAVWIGGRSGPPSGPSSSRRS